jgi:hypothetical protein
MSNLAYDNSAASELIGYVYTIAVSILILSSIMLTSTTMLNGNIANTAQEEAEQLALYFQLSIEDLLTTVREYKVNGTAGGLKVTTMQPRGGEFEVTFPMSPAIAIETTSGLPLISTSSYIVIYYDDNLRVVKLTAG